VVAAISAAEGQKVSRGDVLFVLDAPDTVYTQSADMQVDSQRGGVVSALYVKGGQAVTKDQLLMTVEPLDALEFLVDGDELDIATLKPGDAVQVKVDALDIQVPAVVKTITRWASRCWTPPNIRCPCRSRPLRTAFCPACA
jgi:multidrug resistance efflux pump